MTAGQFLQPEQVSGYDLSSINASLIGEGVQQQAGVIPAVLGTTLRSNLIFKVSFSGSYEAEQDIPDFPTKITRAAGVALARKIGQSVIAGKGGTADLPGIANALPRVPGNATSGKIVVTDINSWYFSVNRFYRASPKAAWLCDDGAYQYLRNATDGSGRPLLNVKDDDETLMGKPLYISPSLSKAFSGSLGVTGAIAWGDWSHLVIRASRPSILRTIEQSGSDVTQGLALWIGRMRCDSTYFDPSGGTNSPIVLAAIN